MSEAKNTVEDEKSGQEVAKQTVSRSHVDYWKSRLFHNFYTREGRRVELSDYAVRILHLGRRETFSLGPNAAKSAEEARKIYGFLEANGWEATLAKFKPKAESKVETATVGALISAASKVAVVKPTSLRFYSNSLRLIAADLAEIEAGTVERVETRRTDGKPGNPKLAGAATRRTPRRAQVQFARKTPEFIAWRAKVDAVPLAEITPELVAKWRASRIAAKSDPTERSSARVSADSLIRGAKALFGRRILPHIARELRLPAVLPFAGVAVGKSAKRFRAEVSAPWLFAAARVELAKPGDPLLWERWKAFALCLLGGLRKGEADCLTWAQLNIESGRIEVRRTEHFTPKSEESERDVDLDPVAVEIMRHFRAVEGIDPVFVLRGGPARPATKFAYYRADRSPWQTWEKLGAWLALKGITSAKPIHALRKLAGSVIHEQFGIEAARDFLGHADIATTSGSYVSKKPRVAVSLIRDVHDADSEVENA